MKTTYADLVPSQMTANEYEAARQMIGSVDDKTQSQGTCPGCRRGKLAVAVVCVSHPIGQNGKAGYAPGIECPKCGYIKLLHKGLAHGSP